MMSNFVAELIGTTILVLLGNGVVANVLLSETKGNGSGWLVICAGWGFAVFTAVLCVGDFSGAHINPAVTIGLAIAGKFAWDMVASYVVAQMLGAILGAVLVYLFYRRHFLITEDADLKLATFCTAPNIRALPSNFFSETLATFVLVFAVLLISEPYLSLPAIVEKVDALGIETNVDDTGEPSGTQQVEIGLGSIGAIRVGIIVFAIGLCLGGTTGYAINPARDLGPRIAHAVLPIDGKRDSDWPYAWVPVFGPIAGGVLAAVLYLLLGGN